MINKIIFSLIFIFLSFQTLIAQVKTFALITDTHISSSETSVEDLENTVRSINDNRAIEFIVIAGDITEEGDRASMEKAKQILDQLNVEYYITSGNHETKWSESGVTDFEKVFGSDRFEFSSDSIYFIGFNSGPVIRMMDGHVGKQDVLWMQQKLDSVGPKMPVIVVTHYPLKDGDVDNWYQVTDLLRNYNVKAILNGHYHSNKTFFYDGIPGIVNRSNLRAKEKVGGYSVYKIDADSIHVYEKPINQEAKQWTSLSLNTPYFTAEKEGYYRPDYSVNTTFPQVKNIWQTHIDGAIYASPIVAEGRVYVGDYNGNMLCLSLKDGKVLWSYDTGNKIFGTAAVANNTLVFSSTDNNIYALNAKTGKLKWVFETPKPVMGGVAIDNDIAYVGGSDSCFYAINIVSGKEVWKYCDINGYIETVPTIDGDKVMFGAWDSYMYALDKNNGSLLWKWNKGDTRMHFSPAAVWPVAGDGKLFFSAPDRFLTALDINTGKEVWRTKESMVRETVGLSQDKERIYSKTMQDSVVCYSAKGNAPIKLWATNVGYGYEHAPSMPQEIDGIVFGSTKNGLIFSIDGKTGELLWKHKVGNSLINTVVPLNKNECIYTSAEGIIGRLKFEHKK